MPTRSRMPLAGRICCLERPVRLPARTPFVYDIISCTSVTRPSPQITEFSLRLWSSVPESWKLARHIDYSLKENGNTDQRSCFGQLHDPLSLLDSCSMGHEIPKRLPRRKDWRHVAGSIDRPRLVDPMMDFDRNSSRNPDIY